jgi:hypothetical protein
MVLTLGAAVLTHAGMGRNPSHYDQEAIEAERLEREQRKLERQSGGKNPAKGIAAGVKQAGLDSTAEFAGEVAEATKEAPPVLGTLEGTRRGSEKVLDNTVKGAVKVATLGFGEVDDYDVQEPEAHSGDSTKISIKIPGT